ncbi:MAG: DUF4358 domain-containing protein [Solobacterium sp.]|nr:DUF4358 domain-containing protein [Solobacterium sp.]
MLKKFVSSLLIIVLLISCGSKNNSNEEAGSNQATIKDLSVADAAKKLAEDLGMINELTEFPSNRTLAMLFQNDKEAVEEAALYLSSDKKADTVGVFKVKETEKCKEYIQSYISSLKDRANNYTPEETFKIDKAIVETNDDSSIIVFVIADNIEDAKGKVNALLGK